MFPIFANTNNYEFPLSGDVTQDISPSFLKAMEGVPELEWAIVTQTASYGDQLGTLADAILELAKAQKTTGPKLKALAELTAEIDSQKAAARKALRLRAEAALERLKKADPEAYDAMITDAATP